MATRNASQDALQALAETLPELFGGAADLSESNLTDLKGAELFEADVPGRNIRFGVREHAMGGIANGIAYHGGLHPVRRHVPELQRLHARLGAPRGALAAARDLRLDARLGRPGRGRPDPPADRALRGAARDAQPVVHATRRRQRDRRRLAAGHRAARRAGRRWPSLARSCRSCPARRSWPPTALRRGGYVLADATDDDGRPARRPT